VSLVVMGHKLGSSQVIRGGGGGGGGGVRPERCPWFSFILTVTAPLFATTPAHRELYK